MHGQGEAIDPTFNVDGTRMQAKGYVTDVLTDYVERFIDRPGDAPFLVYLAHKAMHPNVMQRDDGSVAPLAGQPGGFVAAERHRGRYVGRPMPRRANASEPPTDKPALLQTIDGLPPLGKDTATTDKEIRGRLEMLLAVDESLGRIVATLARKGKLDNTMVVFTSDHGYFYGEHGLNEERRLAYEETIRIPLIVRFPRLVKAGTTLAQWCSASTWRRRCWSWPGCRPAPESRVGRSCRCSRSRPRTGERRSWSSTTATPCSRASAHGLLGGPHGAAQVHPYPELQGMDELYDSRPTRSS